MDRDDLDGLEAEPDGTPDFWQLPAVDLLASPAPGTIDAADLDRAARRLEGALDGFGVRGQVSAVRPGPAAIVHEIVLARGVRASRVVASIDDIARSMNAAWARVVTIPGRNVIGIELPNAARERVALGELIDSRSFADQNASLPIVLGKDVVGEAVVTDLAPMPHLLVAGTTGSGKSVGLNCMILSLLYRLTPKQCRLIMIDPKMLELGAYDDIPHLLAPVVTDSVKAARALKWVVEQVDDRYRQMSLVGVRSVASFNDKISAAKAKGTPLGRKVQNGCHPDTGRPVYEVEQLDFQVLPRIVIIIDELADVLEGLDDAVGMTDCLHAVAERGAVAGIHMVLSSNRWPAGHLDDFVGAVVAGRVAYPLAERREVEAFLGRDVAIRLARPGDSFFISNGQDVVRVYGPFVDEDEVRAVADHWRAQGQCDYVGFVTEESDCSGELEGPAFDGAADADRLYLEAIQLVRESGRTSTSWLQRQLRTGYGSAARLIERMERDGIVGLPDHAGRRQLLVDAAGRPLSRPERPASASRGWLSRLFR